MFFVYHPNEPSRLSPYYNKDSRNFARHLPQNQPQYRKRPSHVNKFTTNDSIKTISRSARNNVDSSQLSSE
jgi:hypothetical protein